MKLFDKILKKEKTHESTSTIPIPVTNWPGLSQMDFLSEYNALELLDKAYWLYHNVSIITDISKTITDEIFRNGLEWKDCFVQKCTKCGHLLMENADSCVICGNTELEEPDAKQRLLYYRADGTSYLDFANSFGQSMCAVLETMSMHIEIANRGVLLVTKHYVLDSVGEILLTIPDEIIALDPCYVQPVFNPRTGKLGDGSRTCICCRDRKKLSSSQLFCPDCGKRTYEIIYKTNMPRSPERYFISGELLMVSKYGYELFGLPLVLNAEDDIILYYYLEKRPRLFYEKAKSPGILFIPTNNPQQLTGAWKSVSNDLEIDPYHFPVMGTPIDAKNPAYFLKLMEDPSVDHITIKIDAMRRIGSLYGVAPLWTNDTSTSGGLNNESQQLTISNRAFERGQRLFNDDVLPWLCEQFGITDYVLQLKPSEDADELRDAQLLSAKLDNVQKALQVGLNVEWSDGELEISGTPKLQEQSYGPVSLPDVPENSGEVSKALQKECPSGEHKHQDFPYCHPEDREHRGNGRGAGKGVSNNNSGDSESGRKDQMGRLAELSAKSPSCKLQKGSYRFNELKLSENVDKRMNDIVELKGSLSGMHVKQIIGYTEGSKLLNGMLDSGNPTEYAESNSITPSELNELIKRIEKLDEAISFHNLKAGIRTFRRADGMAMFGTTDYESLVGERSTRKAYMSTSVIREVAEDYAAQEHIDNPVIIEFSIPPGEGIGLYAKEYSERKDEYEFLMKRDIKYIVTKVDRSGEIVRLRARVVE